MSLRVHHEVRKAIQEGRLVPQPCEVNGCRRTNVVAHHDDYSKALDVRWLCRKHHSEHHWSLRSRTPRVQVMTSVDRETYDALVSLAEMNGRSLAAEIRIAIKERLARQNGKAAA